MFRPVQRHVSVSDNAGNTPGPQVRRALDRVVKMDLAKTMLPVVVAAETFATWLGC